MNNIKLFWKADETIELLKESLKNDQISITSTDTIFGFLANLSKKSFDSLNQIKGGRSEKPYLILIESKEKLSNFIDISELNVNIWRLIDNCWPGPLTIIFKIKEGLPEFLCSKDKKIAIRCPNHDELKKLLKNFNGLFSTSANKSNTKPPEKFSEIDIKILEQVKYLVTTRNEGCVDAEKKFIVDINSSLHQTLPSTIIDISSGKDIYVVRDGAYAIEELEDYYGTKFHK